MNILQTDSLRNLVKQTRSLVILALLLFASPLFAHEASNSYLYWQDSAPKQLRLDIALSDLIANTELRTNALSELRWQELLDQELELAAFIAAHVRPLDSGSACPTNVILVGLTEHGNSTYSVWKLSWPCIATQLRYTLFARDDALHRALMTLQLDGTPELRALSASSPQTHLNSTNSPLDTLAQFIVQGLLHMWLGLDHVLFLLSLLMLVFKTRPRSEHDEPSANRIRQLIMVVTSFTLAHSVTLILSSLSIIQLSSRIVETLIAVSIAVGAVQVLLPRQYLNTLLISFGFGLLHGLGFAGVLAELTAQTQSTLIALLGFNVGVELAQICIVLSAYPLLRQLQQVPKLNSLLYVAASSAIALIGLIWAFQRSGLLPSD